MARKSPDPKQPIQLLVGEEVLMVKRAEDALVAAALPEGRSGFNYSTHQASEGAGDAVNLARTMPMMSRRRVVVIREIEKADSALVQALIDYAGAPSPSTLLVLTGARLPGTSGGKNWGVRLRNVVKKVGQVHKYSAGDVRPDDFVAAYMREQRGEIEPQAARLLIDMVGSDLGRLKGEMDKLLNYTAGTGRIDVAAVEAVCSLIAEAQIWDLTNALVRRDVDQAMAATHRLLEDGEPSHRLLSTVTWQIRNLLVLQEGMAQGGLPKSWARMPRRVTQDAQRLLRARPMRPHQILNALSEANHAFNRSRAGDRRVFEALILRLTAP
ncbi:MAG: DNA polymerase III subunit delta [Myxococcota bacterium]